MIETQGLIQKTVIDNFGANADAEDSLPEPPTFEKLDERMSRIGSRASLNPGSSGWRVSWSRRRGH